MVVECVQPQVDGGRHPVKREIGERFNVSADIYQHGHEILSAVLLHRRAGGGHDGGTAAWSATPLHDQGNDRWEGSFALEDLGVYEYAITAWVETFSSWRRDTERKRAAGQDIASDLIEGHTLVRAALPGHAAAAPNAAAELLLSPELDAEMRAARRAAITLAPLPGGAVFRVLCERERARYGAWYEMFPRSQGTDPSRSATFHEAEARLDEIQALGFDVIYLPPIHPIGLTQRKGPNNALTASPGDPGSPYAIGNDEGGHDAIEPGLGTLADFDHFTAACHARGLEVALDFALNCSPDHPYVRQHPEWFYHRPDGSIKYAENPPKRYEDIYPLNFDGPAKDAIAAELRRVLLFWARHRVRIFRVDNPHTKPMPLWAWLIAEVRAVYPDVVFLAEAFTRPKPMKHLAKIGFSQSYTYFTWRNTKQELTEYLTELALGPAREYFRPNFFTNTPDILPEILQTGSRAAFLSRFILAATLSPSYGIYSGFELCEGHALPGTEEYMDSEKYQYKVWDWDRPGNIKETIAHINRLRREHPALHRIEGLRFLPAANDQMLLYARFTPDYSDLLVVAVNLDPWNVQEGPIEIPGAELGLGDAFAVDDLLAGLRGVWRGTHHHLRLDLAMPAAILHLRPA
ncbi:MAG TPA: alpha-1,4-glucan--maltose-1-phosphate maltosyltransferase [Terriglobales bacterium]|jgi:starch synthase (maltosyl-transferring)